MSEISPPHLKFLCFGVGAIGSYIGGSLALDGNQVVFVERPGIASEVRQNGLSLTINNTTRHFENPEVVESIQEALDKGPFDCSILAIKAYDTKSLADSLLPYSADLPPILSFQNGVDNEPLLASVLGSNKVIYGTVTTSVGRLGPGNITVEKLRGIGVALNHPLSPVLVTVMQAAGLKARGYSNAAGMKWSKMLTNLLANASSAILNMPASAIFNHPGLFALEMNALREALKVMAAQNIPVIDLPSTPVRALAWSATALPNSIARPLLKKAVGGGRGGKMPSFHIDLYSGRGKSEVEFLNGAVAKYGGQYNIRTPVNTTLTKILLQLTSGQIDLATYSNQPQKLLNEIQSH